MKNALDLLLRRRTIVIGVWLVASLGAAAFALQLDGALSGGGFTNPRAEALVTQSAIEEHFGDAPNQMVIVLDSDEAVDRSTIDDAVAVLREAGAVAITGPEDDSTLVSDTGSTALLLAGFEGGNTAAQNLVPELQAELDALATGVSAYVTGQAALDYQLNAHSKEDALRAELIVFPLLIVILLLVFRSVAAMIIPLAIAGSSLGIALGVGYAITQVTELSNLYTNIVSMIGLAVSIDYSLFIIKRFREELARGAEVADAVRVAMARAGHSVFFAGVAVIVALAALLIPQIMAFTSIALGGMIVTVIALVLTQTALPAILVTLGHRIDWGTLPSYRARRTHNEATRRRRGRVHSALVGAAGVAAMLAVAIPALGLSLQSPVASATVLPAGDPARMGLEIATEEVGVSGLFPIQLLISGEDADTTLDAVSAATAFAAEQDGVTHVTSVTSLGMDPSSLKALLSDERVPEQFSALWAHTGGDQAARVLVQLAEGPDSVRAHELVTAFRSELPEIISPASTVGVAGATAQGVDFDDTLIASLPLIAFVVFVLTFLLLAVAFRSVVLPLLALTFNALVVAASLGASTVIQSVVGGGAPLNSVTPVLLFAVMFGLSMDYMVIIIARIVEAFEGGLGYADAVESGLRSTRGMINSAAIVMIAVFLSFMTGQISIVREIGIGLAIAVALDAVVIRKVVMPAVLLVLGPGVLGRRSMLTRRRAVASEPGVDGQNDVVALHSTSSNARVASL